MATFTAAYTDANTIYGRTGLSATEINLTTNYYVIQEAEAEVEYLTGKKFTSGNTMTEHINGQQLDILGYSGNQCTTISLAQYPIQSITSFKIVDISGNTITTFANLTSVQITAGTVNTTDYWLGLMNDPLTGSSIPYGKITLTSQGFTPGIQNVWISYTYGYTTVPVAISTLATCLAGIRAWIYFLGGNYNRLDSYSIPQQSVSKGDFYDRGLKMIASLKEEADRILDRIGRRQRILYTTGGTK